jgi:hypothetical protein
LAEQKVSIFHIQSAYRGQYKFVYKFYPVELGEAISHVRSFLDAVEKAGPRIALKYIVLFSVAFII